VSLTLILTLIFVIMEEWIPPNGERMVSFVLRRLDSLDVDVSRAELIDMFRDIGHMRYAHLGKVLDL